MTARIKRKKAAKEKELKDQAKNLTVNTVKLDDVVFHPSTFETMSTGNAIDHIFTVGGKGIPRATNYMVIGDPGVGKTTLCLDILGNIEHSPMECVISAKPIKKRVTENGSKVKKVVAYEDVKIGKRQQKTLFISAEMTRVDMHLYTKRYPKFGQVETLFLGEYGEHDPRKVIEQTLNKGYDLVLIDSFVAVQETVREFCNENGLKMSAKGSEKWLIDLMLNHNEDRNETGHMTAFLFIQQMTKGGVFVGSNHLKHATTGTLELRFTKNGQYAFMSKNRRGDVHKNLYYDFDLSQDVKYNFGKFQRDKENSEIMKKEINKLTEDDNTFGKLFNIDNEQES